MKADGIKPRETRLEKTTVKKNQKDPVLRVGMVGQQSEVQSQWTQGMETSLGHIHKDISSEATGLVESSVSSSAEQGLTLERKRQTDVRAAGDIYGDLPAKIRERRLPNSAEARSLPRTWASKHGVYKPKEEKAVKSQELSEETSTSEESRT